MECDKKEIILIGTVHTDPLGAGSLYKWLLRLKPNIITVEISPFSISYRKKMLFYWLKKLNEAKGSLRPKERDHFQIQILYRSLLIPFEWVVSRAYAKNVSIPCIPIDIGEISKKELPKWSKELISSFNLKLLVQQTDKDIVEFFDSKYKTARKILFEKGNDFVFNLALNSKEFKKRDKVMAKKLLRFIKYKDKLVHVGGWQHLIITNKYSLVSLLEKDFKENDIVLKRILLR